MPFSGRGILCRAAEGKRYAQIKAHTDIYTQEKARHDDLGMSKFGKDAISCSPKFQI
jgi:hypothetical protein